MSKPIAILISDVHYSVPTLDLADAALKQALYKANELNVPLVVAGDLHDTKANMRAECVNTIIQTIKLGNTKPYVIIGNHDLINERDTSKHALEFLEPHATLITKPTFVLSLNATLVPYQASVEAVEDILHATSEGSLIIAHQGCEGSKAGEYFHDKTALYKEAYAAFRVISGHYHTRQDIKTGSPQKNAVGLFSYLGNPYTLNFGEALDPAKGFHILNNDRSLTFVPTNLRKHIVYDITKNITINHSIQDLIKVKFTGTNEQIRSMTKESVAEQLNIIQPFKFETTAVKNNLNLTDDKKVENLTLDVIIDSQQNVSDEQKFRLKNLWRSI